MVLVFFRRNHKMSGIAGDKSSTIMFPLLIDLINSLSKAITGVASAEIK